MGLFYLVWDEEGGPQSVLIDAPNEALASSRGAQHYAEGPPSRVVRVPANVFIAQADEDEDGVVSFLCAEHVDELLEGYEDGDPVAAVGAFCMAEADEIDDAGKATGAVLHCEKSAHHDGRHRSAAGSEWE